MNGGGKRRFPTTVAANSILVFVISAVTAQQVFEGNQEIDFLRRQSLFQPNQVAFQRNRNFILPSASALRHRNLFTRQISHRHFRSRLRSNSRISAISHQSPSRPSQLTKSARRVLMKNQSRTKPNATANDRSNQRTTKLISNISRRQNQLQPSLMSQRFQQPVQRAQRVRNQHFPGFRAPVVIVKASPRDAQNQVPTTRTAVPRISVTRDPFSIRAPLSPMPFGSVQQSSIRRPARPTPLISTSQTDTTTTPLPPSTSSTSSSVQPSAILGLLPSAPKINSVGGPLRRPIRVQQLQLNLRRKPQVTRGQFRRPKVALIKHQPAHRISKKPDRVTKPISSTTSEPIATTEADQTTAAATTAEDVQQQTGNIGDIEAAILKAIIESSSPEPPPSSTHRQRAHRVRLGKNGRRPLPPTAPRVDAIEEAVLKAVLEASTSAPEEVTAEGVATATTEQSTTVQKSESTSLFPAFASRRHGRRRLSTTVIPTTEEETTPTALTRTEEAATTPTTELLTTELPTTTEEPTTTVVEETTTVMVNEFTIALPGEEFEDINAESDAENHQIEQIKENIISDLTTPTTASPSPVPPSPLPSILPSSSSAPPHELLLQPGPPGSMPPSDDIVDELNGSSDFLQVAERLHLLRRLLQ